MPEYVAFWFFFFFSSRRRHTRCLSDWSSDVCSSDLPVQRVGRLTLAARRGRKHPASRGRHPEGGLPVLPCRQDREHPVLPQEIAAALAARSGEGAFMAVRPLGGNAQPSEDGFGFLTGQETALILSVAPILEPGRPGARECGDTVPY